MNNNINNESFLILQMQRLGDIILSFPLMLWLKKQNSDRKIFVVAEQSFYNELLDISPPVTYLPWTATREVENNWGGVINLSHRPEAAALAGVIQARKTFGPILKDNTLRVLGKWQLYLASLTDNNRHNRFHWVELFSMDSVDKTLLGSTQFPCPRDSDTSTVGFFLGASQREKRPDSSFWAALARECEQRGLRPLLFGGPEDLVFGNEVKALHGGNIPNLCGSMTLREFAKVGQNLALLVTPDTGPMHLASWTGLKVLNLSMGPVNPWETGPYNPGHYVLRASFSCLGCWRCRFETPYCKYNFDPSKVAYLVRRLVTGDRIPTLRRMQLYRTGRTTDGFYNLIPVAPPHTAPKATDLIGELWRNAFLANFGIRGESMLAESCLELSKNYPHVALTLGREIESLVRDINTNSMKGIPLPSNFWNRFPPVVRPLTGYIQMRLGNEDYAPHELVSCLKFCDMLRSALT